MDLSVKSIFSVLFTFIAMMLILSVFTFYCVSTNARETLYSTIENIEQYGYQSEIIDQVAHNTNTTINVTPVETNDELNRYEVSVSFHHVFAFVNVDKQITYTGITRAVDF